MKKVVLSCAVAAAVGLSFNVSAHDQTNVASSGVHHADSTSGSVKTSGKAPAKASTKSTVKTDATKVYDGVKEYGHKAYDATKSTAKSAYDSSKKLLSGDDKSSAKKPVAKPVAKKPVAKSVSADTSKNAPEATPKKKSMWEHVGP